LDPDRVKSWSDREVTERWARLYPPRDSEGNPLAVSEDWLAAKAVDTNWIDKIRPRLSSLSWFMKCLKEPLARRANREDNVTGAFWAARFKSVAILDEESLLATCAYVDLNPLAAGLAAIPEESRYTSIHARVEHYRKHGALADLVAEETDRTKAEQIETIEQIHVECWTRKLGRLFGGKRLLGTALGRLESLERYAAARGKRWVNNLAGRLA
jgi:hypothetical protein